LPAPDLVRTPLLISPRASTTGLASVWGCFERNSSGSISIRQWGWRWEGRRRPCGGCATKPWEARRSAAGDRVGPGRRRRRRWGAAAGAGRAGAAREVGRGRAAGAGGAGAAREVWDAAGGEVGARRLLGERLGGTWERWDPGESEDM